jgi:hypothetical protein
MPSYSSPDDRSTVPWVWWTIVMFVNKPMMTCFFPFFSMPVVPKGCKGSLQEKDFKARKAIFIGIDSFKKNYPIL